VQSAKPVNCAGSLFGSSWAALRPCALPSAKPRTWLTPVIWQEKQLTFDTPPAKAASVTEPWQFSHWAGFFKNSGQ
jgi:hypothetical protein